MSVLTVPFKFISPAPLGAIVISPLDTETIEFPLTSSDPPSWGEVSTNRDVIAPATTGTNVEPL